MRAVGGRTVGMLAVTVTLLVLGFLALGLLTSLGGWLIAGTIATVAGIAASLIAEPSKADRNAIAVAGYVAILFLAYAIAGQVALKPPPPGWSQSGPAVMEPR